MILKACISTTSADAGVVSETKLKNNGLKMFKNIVSHNHAAAIIRIRGHK
jgi:hypothetical protein